ncbi:MAG: metallophosphoesterase [Firmicutes bacterium]|nr:metallophosphoesterase [Bacillota bacterium]
MKLTIMIAIFGAIALVGAIIFRILLIKAVDRDRDHRLRVRIPILILMIMVALPIIGALVPDGPVCWFFQKWGNISIGFAMYFFLSLLFLSIIAGILLLIFKGRGGGSKLERKPSGKVAKALLYVSLVSTIVINILGMGHAVDVKVTNYQMPKEVLGLKEPLKMVLIADLHIGVNSGTEIYEKMVARINEQDADLVVIAGDLVTSSFNAMRDPEKYASIFREIKSKNGVYAVYGNHDVDEPLMGGFTYINKKYALRNPAMEPWVKSCGWNLLEDEVTEIPGIEGMVLAGRRDEEKPGDDIDERATLPELLKDVDPDKKVLLLQHEPSDLEDLGEDGVALSLSGHTHDGQIFPGNVYCRLFLDQSYGYKEWGSAKAIVTSGVGFYGPPLRVGTISEIVVLDLI